MGISTERISMVSSRLGTPLATITTFAPLLASSFATLLPMPWEPPVMTMV